MPTEGDGTPSPKITRAWALLRRGRSLGGKAQGFLRGDYCFFFSGRGGNAGSRRTARACSHGCALPATSDAADQHAQGRAAANFGGIALGVALAFEMVGSGGKRNCLPAYMH